MRVLQVLYADAMHTGSHAAHNRERLTWESARQVRAMLEAGVGAHRAWAADLTPADVFICYGDDGASQTTWAREAGMPEPYAPGAILAAQIAAFSPDVVLVDAALSALADDMRKALKPGARFLGCAAHPRMVGDPAVFDAIVVADLGEPLPDGYRALPMRRLAPGIPPATGYDVFARAHILRDDPTASILLRSVAKAPLGLMGEFSIAWSLTAEAPPDIAVGLAMHDGGPLWGQSLRDALAGARLVIDVNDGASVPARTDRLLALAACGAAILAEDTPALRACFPVDQELVTFQTPDELVERVYELLRDRGRRRAMGAAARRRAIGAGPASADDIKALLGTAP